MSSESKIQPSVFIAKNATVVGDVSIGKESSVWFGAVIRGDSAPIVIGDATNVQDHVVIHADKDAPTKIGNRVTIGHGAIVHGAIVGDDVLVGIGAIILNRARIGEHCIIAAGALIPEDVEIPPRSLVVGVPAKVVRQVTDADVERIHRGAREYIHFAKQHQGKG